MFRKKTTVMKDADIKENQRILEELATNKCDGFFIVVKRTENEGNVHGIGVAKVANVSQSFLFQSIIETLKISDTQLMNYLLIKQLDHD